MPSPKLFAILCALCTCLAGPAAASADIRTAVIDDVEDPGLALDVKTATVVVDSDAGVARFSIALWRPAAQATAAYDDTEGGLAMDVANDEDACEGGITAGGRATGDLPYINVVTNSDYDAASRKFVYSYKLNYKVNYRTEILTAPVTFSPDRLTLTFEISDPLLVGTDMRCVSGYARGRPVRDVTRADGGPTMETKWSGWFQGFRPPFRVRYSSTSPQRFKRGGDNLEHATRCTFACSVRVRGYATTLKGTEIPGLPLHHDYKAEEGELYETVYGFKADETRRLLRAFARHGRVQFVLNFRAEDTFGRVQKFTRRITLLPPRTPRSRNFASRPSGGGGGGDRDCSDFSSQASAQSYFDHNGGSASTNVDGLDSDHDGVACEALP